MAKTANPKKRSQASLRPNSRALRRQTSPSLAGNIDRSLKDLPRPQSPDPTRKSTTRPVLAPSTSSRVSKKPKRGKHSRAQRLRSEKSKEKASRNKNVLEGKVNESWDRAKRTKARKEGWDVVQGGLKLSGEKGGEEKDTGENGALETAVAQKADARPLKEKMEAVDFFEAQNALGDLVVSEELDAPRDKGVQESQLDVSGGAEQVEDILATAFIQNTTEAPAISTDTGANNDTNGIT